MRVRKSIIRRRFSGAGALLLASMVAACGTAQSKEQGGSADPASKLLASAEKTAGSVVSAVAEALGTPAVKPEQPSPPPPAVEARPVRRPKPARPQPEAPVEAAPVPGVADDPVPEPAPVPVVEEVVAVPVITKVHDYKVYSAADVDIVPPTPPVASGLRPWRIKAGPSVEVIVAGDGTVEKVQVLGATRMSDAMVLSHVKSWKFAPALRDGEPVRYRLLLDDPVTAP